MGHVVEGLLTALISGFFVWLWTIYNRTQMLSAWMRETKDDIMELKTNQSNLSARTRALEDANLLIGQEMKRLPSMEAKIDRLLTTQVRESPGRVQDNLAR